MKKTNKKLKQKQKQKQKQTVIVNIDNSKKVVRRKPSKGTSQPNQPQPTIIPQPIYIPQYNYPAPPVFQQPQPERKPFSTEPEKPSGFQPNPVNDIILDPINPLPDVNQLRERRNTFFSTPQPEIPTQTDTFMQAEQPPKSKFSVPFAPSRRFNPEPEMPPLVPDRDSDEESWQNIYNMLEPESRKQKRRNKKSRSAKSRLPENLCQGTKKNGEPCSFMKVGGSMYCRRHQPKLTIEEDDDI